MSSLSATFTPLSQLPVPDQFVERLTPLADLLPARMPVELRTEADFYGASWEIARATGLAEAPRAISSWFHGFIHSLVSPNQFLWNDENVLLNHHLVSKQEEVEFLASHGIDNAHAVGAPFLYAPPSGAPRIPRSLLIAPGLNQHLATSYAEQLDGILESVRPLRSRLDFILCCFKPRFLTNPNLAEVLIKHDIPWVEGAEFQDANALKRMRTLYSSFEVVMSDTVGAHLAQASICGARVCVFGPTPKLDRALLAATQHNACERVRNDSRMLDSFVDNPDYYRERLPFLFRSPDEAGAFPEWGGEMLGMRHQRPHVEIARLLGWHWCAGSPVSANSAPTEIAAQLGWLPATAISAHALHESLHELGKLQLSLPGAVAEIKMRRKEHKSLAKELERAKSNHMKLTGKYEELTPLPQSFAWRLVGKHVYFVDENIRRHLPGK